MRVRQSPAVAAAAAAAHTASCRLYDVIHADKRLYLVFEYLDLDLKKLMDALPGFSSDDRLIKVRSSHCASTLHVELHSACFTGGKCDAVRYQAYCGTANDSKFKEKSAANSQLVVHAMCHVRDADTLCCIAWLLLLVVCPVLQLYLWQMLSGIAYCHSRR
jgi:hypothetical protein